ncbi:MAG: phosphatase PAP2 family protein [Acidimicrobiales bacterium]
MAQATHDSRRLGDSTSSPRRFGWTLGRELLVVFVGFVAYRGVRAMVKDEFSEAFTNAHKVIDWERAIGIFTEVDLQSGVIQADAAIWALNRYYFFAHFLGAAVLLVWLYMRHAHCYGRVRRVMVITTFTSLALHVAFPLAPPRWFPEFGFVDTLQTYGPRIYDSSTVTSTANQIAAMPSLHVGWAVIIAWAVVMVASSRWRWLIVIHPLVMTAAVVLTANHWWLDALVAALLVMVAIAVDTPVQRWLEVRELRHLGDQVARESDDERDRALADLAPGPTHTVVPAEG